MSQTDAHILAPSMSIMSSLIEGDDRNLPSIQVAKTLEENEAAAVDDAEERVMQEVETNLRTIIEYGNSAVQELADKATDQESPRAYEALASLMKSVTAANNSLLNVRRKDRIVTNAVHNPASPKPEDPAGDVVIRGTVAEILRALGEDRKAGYDAKIINGTSSNEDIDDIE